MANEQRDQSVERPPDLDEAQLALAARAGSRVALNELIRLLTADVLGLLWWKVGNREDAEDLTQDTFVKLQKSIRHYQPTRPIRAWVFRIATNTAIDFIRRRQRLHEKRLDLTQRELELIEDQGGWQSETFESREVASRSRELVESWIKRFLPGERLKRVRQAVFMLLDGYGDNWRAIAKACGYKSSQSAKNSVTQKVRKALESAEALEAARIIYAELRRNRPPHLVRFLGLIDLKIESSHEKENS